MHQAVICFDTSIYHLYWLLIKHKSTEMKRNYTDLFYYFYGVGVRVGISHQQPMNLKACHEVCSQQILVLLLHMVRYIHDTSSPFYQQMTLLAICKNKYGKQFVIPPEQVSIYMYIPLYTYTELP